MLDRYNLGPNTEEASGKSTLLLPHGVRVEVRKKHQVELGATPYYFSYSFKGEQENHPIDPKNLTEIAKEMRAKLSVHHNPTIIAFDRGGTALGVALSVVAGLPLFIAFSYYNVPPENSIAWHEPGGGKYLAVPKLPLETHVVLVDDEVNTGATFKNAIDSLRNNGAVIDQVLVVAEIQKRFPETGRLLIEGMKTRLDSLYKIPEPVFLDSLGDYVFPQL